MAEWVCFSDHHRSPPLIPRPPLMQVIPSTYQIRGMHTLLRDKETNKNDFVFYVSAA